jgi:hypothetical protein
MEKSLILNPVFPPVPTDDRRHSRKSGKCRDYRAKGEDSVSARTTAVITAAAVIGGGLAGSLIAIIFGGSSVAVPQASQVIPDTHRPPPLSSPASLAASAPSPSPRDAFGVPDFTDSSLVVPIHSITHHHSRHHWHQRLSYRGCDGDNCADAMNAINAAAYKAASRFGR